MGEIVGFRRNPEDVAAARRWREFLERHAALVDRAGLPPAAVESEEVWDDFLMHGFLAGDPGQFTVDQLTAEQYDALAELTASYFSAGYGFFAPLALRPAEQDALRAEFDAPEHRESSRPAT